MAKKCTPDPSAPHNAGVLGDPLATYKPAELERLAHEAGCTSPEDHSRFRQTLSTAITFFLIDVSAPSKPQIRDQLKAVADASRSLVEAMDNLDWKVLNLLTRDMTPYGPGVDFGDEGAAIRAAAKVSNIKGGVFALLISSASLHGTYADGPAERRKRGPSINALAERMALLYCRDDRKFKVGKYDKEHGYQSQAVQWLTDLLKPAIPDITDAEIAAAAIHCREVLGDPAEIIKRTMFMPER